MKRKKIVSMLLASAMAATLLAGCGAGGKSSSKGDSDGEIKEFNAFFAVPGSEINDDNEVQQIIAEKTTLTIAYVIEDDKIMETSFKDVLKKIQEREQKRSQSMVDERRKGDGQFYRGTLRSGQSLESDASVVVVGDVNPGASVCAKGNVVVLGCAKGYLSAGCDGDDHAFVAALDMQPMQIRIGKHIARSADGEPEKKKKLFGRSKNNDNQPMEAQIAFVEDENIYIEPISKALLNEIIV